jgi:CDP-glycerol glycerophosphotransferase
MIGISPHRCTAGAADAVDTFTFAAGNRRVLLRTPLYLLGALGTVVVPRTARLWVFGSGIGLGEGALALYELARDELGGDVRLVWLAGTPAELDEARRRGFDAVARQSASGFWLTLRARVLVVTHGLGDVNRFGVWGGFVVQLWHGIPLKKLHLDSPVVLGAAGGPVRRTARAALRLGYRTAGSQIGLFPVASARIVERIASGFGTPRERIVATGDPRDDLLLAGPAAQRRVRARALLSTTVGPLPDGADVVLYAPTWRDGAVDPGAPYEATWDEIAHWLETNNAVLVVRNHPLGRADYAAGPTRSDRVRLLDARALADVTPVLPAVDALITDYSSIAFDYALVGGPIVFFAPDADEYVRSRGLYEPYRLFTGGRQVANWAHVLAELTRIRVDPGAADDAREHTAWLRDENFDHLDPGSAARVLAEIQRRTAHVGPPAPSPPTRSRPHVTAVGLAGTTLTVQVRGLAAGTPTARLDGARGGVYAEVDRAPDGTVTATFDLLVSRWGSPALALPSGDYSLVLGDRLGGAAADGTDAARDGTVPLRGGTDTSRNGAEASPDEAEASPDGAEPSPNEAEAGTAAGLDPAPATTRVDVVTADRPTLRHPLFRADVVDEAGGLVLRVGAPLAENEARPVPHRDLRQAYFRGRVTPENAVYFESFYGRSASDNPLAIDRTLARLHPQVRRYWSVADGSVAVPPGAVPIIEGSHEWWRVRAEARVYVINDWLRWSFRRRKHQHVLQTWHGTMLKRLALDRADITVRRRSAVMRQQHRWDALIAQNPYSTAIFRSAYAFRAPIWETGYPRNDVLTHPERVAAVRAAIGVPDGARLVLYAPTWRDDRAEMVDYLDLAAFAADLPEDHVLLVRGHSRTLSAGRDVHGVRLIDVTSYPDMAELKLIADVLVTDYSSVMFDFASTGKPMVFFTPDLAYYGDVVRGFYFDLPAEAPGPVVTTPADLRDAILGEDNYAAARAAWKQRFTPWDDGQASERIVRRMFAEGWLD